MGRRPQENPTLDMTPMIDVVFELIIFFVVTLVEAEKKDESIELEDGKHGSEITPEELPDGFLMIDVSKKGRISISDQELTPEQVKQRVIERKKRAGGADFPILIRADFETEHQHVAKVMNACTSAGVWKLSFVAVLEDKDKEHPRKRLKRLKGR